MSSINKKDLREAIKIFRSVANNSVLISLANTFAFSIAKFNTITLENTRDALYNFIVKIRDIKTWEELTDGIASIVNNTFMDVYKEDIMTKESFDNYLTTHPLRQSSTESESYDSDTESMGPTGSNINRGESKLESKGGPPPGIDPHLWEVMQEAREAGWGKPQPPITSIPRRATPMLRQTSISELPPREWAEREVLGATLGSSVDSYPSYSSEIAKMMMVEDPVMRKNNIAEGELWSNAAHVARARRYTEEGKDVRHDDKMTMSKLKKQGGKRKTKRKRKTRKRKKTRKKKHKKKTKKRRKNNRKKRTKRRR